MSEIHQQMLNEISANLDKSEGGFTYDITKSVALVIENQQVVSENVIDKMDVDNLTGDELTKFVFQRTGRRRKVATYATTQVLLTGTPLTEVVAGSLVAADDVFYETTDAVFLNEQGQTSAWVKCQIDGPIGNVPTGAIDSFPVTIPGVTSVTNLEAVTDGYIGEIDAELRERYYDRLQKPGRAGNVYHYEEWATSVTGVGKVKVYPLWNGPLTVKVVVVDMNGEIPSEALINTVFEYVESERPFGAVVTIAPVEAITIDVSVDITVAEGLSNEDVRITLEARITSYLRSIALEANYVSRAQIGRIILETSGIVDYVDLTINDSDTNIDLPDAHIPVLGMVTLL